jgi:hypothetical protein
MQLATQGIDMCGGCWYQTGATRGATLPPEWPCREVTRIGAYG